MVAATHDEKFGWPVVKAYWDYIKEKVTTGQIRSLYDVSFSIVLALFLSLKVIMASTYVVLLGCRAISLRLLCYELRLHSKMYQ